MFGYDDRPYDGVGALLRETRERRDQDLADIAAILRIRQLHLEAIENGRFDDLPGRIYAVGFLRTYAEYLGLDAEYVVDLMYQETAHTLTDQKLVFPAPEPASRLPKMWMLAVSVVVVVGLAFTWNIFREPGDAPVVTVAEVPNRLAGLTESPQPVPEPVQRDVTAADAATPDGSLALRSAAPKPAPPAPVARVAPKPAAVPSEPPAAAAPRPEAPPATTQRQPASAPPAPKKPAAKVEAPAEPAPKPAPKVVEKPKPVEPKPVAKEPEPVEKPREMAAVNPAPPPVLPRAGTGQVDNPSQVGGQSGYVPQVYGVGNTGARVVLRARRDVWVQVQGAGNELLLTKFLRAGDTYHVPDRPDVVLSTGNAAALDVIVDGKRRVPLGGVGIILRDVSLHADKLLAASASQ